MSNVPEPVTRRGERVHTAIGDLWLPADDQVMLPYLRTTGAWEPSEERLLSSLMKARTRFLDVGANVGYFSVLAAKRSPQGTIDAVEPNAANVAFLRMNLWLHARHASIWPVALGNRHGVVSLASDPNNYGDTRVVGEGDVGGMLAAMVRGDDLFEGRTFDVIKIDVQGFEREVLEGLRELIQRARRLAIVAEFMPRAIQERGLHPLEVLAGYRRLGLRPVTCIEDRLEAMDDQETLALCLRSGPDGFVNLLLHKG